MFLTNSICNYRSTEPIWFRFFRGFVAVILSIVIIYYSIYQIKKVDEEISIIVRSENLESKNKLDYRLYSKFLKLILNFFK